MHRRRVLAVTGSLLAGALAGCSAPDPSISPDPTATPQPTAAEPTSNPSIDEATLDALVSDTNVFSLDLFREITGESPGKNRLVSPLSVTTTMAMAYTGARGETRTQMNKALNYSVGADTLHAAFNALQRTLNERGEDLDPEDRPSTFDEDDDPVPFELTLVNAVWGQADYPFEEDYLRILEDHYGGGLREVDYRADPEAARETINEWVAAQTANRIEELLPQGALNALTRLVLTNAVYFTANWQDPFDAENTESASFTPLEGTTTKVPMMQKEEQIPYGTVDRTKAIELPYLGGEVSMLVVLPPENELTEYERNLDESRLQALIDALERQQVEVALPKFSFDDSQTLKPILQSLGMKQAFDPTAADFSAIADPASTQEQLYLYDVYHDTDITVDETGTEAAAATGTVIGATSTSPEPVRFIADRPFLFAIRDRPTGAILFLGRVVDAGQAQ